MVSLGKKRQSLGEILQGIERSGDQVRFLFFEEARQNVEKSKFFRWQGPHTQAKQDRHLANYLNVVRSLHNLPEEEPEDNVIAKAFPADHEEYCYYVKTFVAIAYQHAAPRSKDTGDHILYSTLVEYRQSMLYWSNRMYRKLEMQPPSHSRIFNDVVDTMRYMQKTYGDKDAPRPRKTHVGLLELCQLIEYDMMTTTCIALAEQHHLAWCLGRILALRPGSIGADPKDPKVPHLVWSDLTFTREPSEPTRFTVAITIRHFKDSNDPERQKKKAETFYIRSPNRENLIFSVPHRLLVIALRRNLVQDVNSLDDLLTSDKRRVTLKPTCLDQPVLYAGGPRGLSVDFSKPMTSHALGGYLAIRGFNYGYPHRLNFYSIRRRAATDLSRRFGRDLARKILNHEPDSRALEKHYLEMLPGYDATAAALGENTGHEGQSPGMAEEHPTLAAKQLDADRLRRTRGASLNIVVDKIIQNDPDRPTNADDATYKNYRRRVSRQARKIIFQEQLNYQEASMTLEEYDAQMIASKASNFSAAVLDRARDLASGGTNAPQAAITENMDLEEQQDIEYAEDHQDEDDDGLEPAPDLDDMPEGDVEVDLEDDASGQETEDIADPEAKSYEQCVRTLMGIIIGHTMSTNEVWAYGKQTCPLCAQDETVDDEKRNHRWRNKSKLDNHLDGAFHSGYSTWSRRIRQHHVAGTKWPCPYCPQSSGSASGSDGYYDLATLVRHIEHSNAVNTSNEHDDLKQQDGWYEDDFRGTVSRWVTNERKIRAKRRLSAMGFEDPRGEMLPGPSPHPTIPGIVLGSFREGLPAHLKDQIIISSLQDALMSTGTRENTTRIEEKHSGTLKVDAFPKEGDSPMEISEKNKMKLKMGLFPSSLRPDTK